jgi:hypothetical protein
MLGDKYLVCHDDEKDYKQTVKVPRKLVDLGRNIKGKTIEV